MVRERMLTGDSRHVVGPDGELWHIYELVETTYDRRSSLVFETEGVIRRVRNYPAEWRLLPDAELLALSWQA
jgi:hypothetical protein